MTAGSTWTELSARVRACTACPELVATRRSVVVGEAPPGAEVLLVGEAPGAAEDASGRPFVGRSGLLLEQLLTDVGLDRSSTAVLNILKCRPPGNRRPAPAEVDRCTGWLREQIALVDPAVTCLLGGTATAWALGRQARIGTARGRTHLLDGRLLVVSYHPSAALRFGPAGAPLAALRADLALVARLAAEAR